MAGNIYTKGEILKNLADKGYFIDARELDNFIEKWKLEAIFEDEQGSEFYDKNALELVMNNLNKMEQEKEQAQKEAHELELKILQRQEAASQYPQNVYDPINQSMMQHYPPNPMNANINDPVANNLLNSIALADGTPLMNKVQNSPVGDYVDYQMMNNSMISKNDDDFEFGIEKEKKMGILEGAILATGQEIEEDAVSSEYEEEDFDDMSLLSESLEAQEKFREYVVSELSKKNVDLTPQSGEFKFDVPEKALNMIARSMGKKIVKYVNQLYGGDPKISQKLEDLKSQNKKLDARVRELEDQNKKLRLLLAESNKNLNSYQPSMFGLYKKVPPRKK